MSGLIPLDARWHDLFETFKHTAYRLELRERYNTPSLREPLQRYLATGHTEMGWLETWLTSIRAQAAEGKLFQRVRVVSLPLSDYNRFGLWTAEYNNAAGEDIRYLTRENAEDLPEFEYWLFDSRTVAKLHFGDEDTLLGFELIEDPAAVVELNYQRDAAWHRAITRDEFAAQHLDQGEGS